MEAQNIEVEAQDKLLADQNSVDFADRIGAATAEFVATAFGRTR
jgi:hypothetical protein